MCGISFRTAGSMMTIVGHCFTLTGNRGLGKPVTQGTLAPSLGAHYSSSIQLFIVFLLFRVNSIARCTLG